MSTRETRQALATAASLMAVFGAALIGLDASAAPSIYPTGVTRYNPARAYNSFVLFSGQDHKTHLIDMNGNEVHTWAYDGSPPVYLDPRLTHGALGHVLVRLAQSAEHRGTGLGQGTLVPSNKTIAELDWDGRVLWHWGEAAPGGAAQQHHDLARLDNGNTLLLVNRTTSIPGFRLHSLRDDGIYEVTPAGRIVWQWFAADHLTEIFSPETLKLVRATTRPDYLHVNDMKPLGPNHWFRSGDGRFDPSNIIIDSRQANFIAIISKRTGKIVWRLGPDYPAGDPSIRPTRLPRPVDSLSGQHDAQLIPDGLPGAGNLLVFDNQGSAGYPPAELSIYPSSRVLEIDPIRRLIVWQYTGDASGRVVWTFHSSFISSARRLPNDNTLIDEGMNGRLFQITPAGEIVWEYVSPYFGPTADLGFDTDRTVLSNQVYRCQPVPYNWAPSGTAHAERAVVAPDLATFRVPGAH
jgi:Arylsulfotransferase (ASST)